MEEQGRNDRTNGLRPDARIEVWSIELRRGAHGVSLACPSVLPLSSVSPALPSTASGCAPRIRRVGESEYCSMRRCVECVGPPTATVRPIARRPREGERLRQGAREVPCGGGAGRGARAARRDGGEAMHRRRAELPRRGGPPSPDWKSIPSPRSRTSTYRRVRFGDIESARFRATPTPGAFHSPRRPSPLLLASLPSAHFLSIIISLTSPRLLPFSLYSILSPIPLL
jgi:hypothetical protein